MSNQTAAIAYKNQLITASTCLFTQPSYTTIVPSSIAEKLIFYCIYIVLHSSTSNAEVLNNRLTINLCVRCIIFHSLLWTSCLLKFLRCSQCNFDCRVCACFLCSIILTAKHWCRRARSNKLEVQKGKKTNFFVCFEKRQKVKLLCDSFQQCRYL